MDVILHILSLEIGGGEVENIAFGVLYPHNQIYSFILGDFPDFEVSSGNSGS